MTKRLFLAMFAAAAALSMTSCERDGLGNDESTLSRSGFTFTAAIEAPAAVRTALVDGAEAAQVTWKAGDNILLVMQQAYDAAASAAGGSFTPALYTAASVDSDATVAKFVKGEGAEGQIEVLDTDTFWAIYGGGVNAAYTKGQTAWELQLPAEQNGESFASAAAMVAKAENVSSEGLNLSFKNLHSILRVSVTGDKKLESITFRGNAGEKVAGTYTVDFAGSDITACTFGAEAATQIVLACGVLLTDQPQSFDVLVPAGEYKQGYTVELAIEGGDNIVRTVGKESGRTIARSTIYKLPVVDANAPAGNIAEACYIYGESCYGLPLASAIELEKTGEGIFAGQAYFMTSADGKNPVLLNTDSREEKYPCYAVAADGKVVEVASAGAELPQGPAIDIDGLRKITVNMNTLTWEWERVTNQFSVSDEYFTKYKTKEYIARDGSRKLWMVEWLDWDGGGSMPKMGSAMPVSETGVGSAGNGGYREVEFPTSWDDTSHRNYDYETTEIGGTLGTNGGFSPYGRIYSFSEMVTGIPQYGLGFHRYEALPEDWQIGGKGIADVFGERIPVKQLPSNAEIIASLTGDNSVDEAANPLFTLQVQGVCPYGWHVANVADWLDIAYAASQASSGDTYPVNESRVTYKQFFTNSGTATSGDANSARGIGNLAAWLRNHAYWANKTIADGADDFGFNYYPIGYRYMTTGFNYYGLRVQAWVPFPMVSSGLSKGYTTGAGTRVNVIIGGTNTATYAELTNLDCGQAICPVRCVKNYFNKK